MSGTPPSEALRVLSRFLIAVIEQAKGMLMANSPGMSPDDAFDILRKASQRENVELREVAQRIVERRPAVGLPQ